jgi:hypothetical protein
LSATHEEVTAGVAETKMASYQLLSVVAVIPLFATDH